MEMSFVGVDDAISYRGWWGTISGSARRGRRRERVARRSFWTADKCLVSSESQRQVMWLINFRGSAGGTVMLIYNPQTLREFKAFGHAVPPSTPSLSFICASFFSPFFFFLSFDKHENLYENQGYFILFLNPPRSPLTLNIKRREKNKKT